jgi:hypothetical protein
MWLVEVLVGHGSGEEDRVIGCGDKKKCGERVF